MTSLDDVPGKHLSSRGKLFRFLARNVTLVLDLRSVSSFQEFEPVARFEFSQVFLLEGPRQIPRASS